MDKKEEVIPSVSRIGKKPIPIPQGVKVKVEDRRLSVDGPKGQCSKEFPADMRITVGDKDSYQALRRKWIYEFAELSAIKGRDVERVAQHGMVRKAARSDSGIGFAPVAREQH